MKIWEILYENEIPEVELHVAGKEFEPPLKTVIAYKLFRVDKRFPGKLFPLFVLADDPIQVGRWYEAREGEVIIDAKTGDKGVKSRLGKLAYRPGWHGGDLPISHHIGGNRMRDPETGRLAPTTRRPNQVWAEVEFPADKDWQEEANSRAIKYKSDSAATGRKKGDIRPETAHITDQVPKGGYYKYKTSPNMTGMWLIAGAMKVNRVLSDDEVHAINHQAGVEDLPREQPLDLKKFGF